MRWWWFQELGSVAGEPGQHPVHIFGDCSAKQSLDATRVKDGNRQRERE
jgi:hypothetical protein